MHGSVGSLPRHSSWPVVLPFGCVELEELSTVPASSDEGL